MKVNLTHNESIQTFNDAARHVELEEERLLNDKGTKEAFVAGSSSHKRSGSKEEERQ